MFFLPLSKRVSLYQILTVTHSLLRWFVVISLIIAVIRAYQGVIKHKKFTKADDRIRHWTATVAHLQMLVGLVLYMISPIIQYFWKNRKEGMEHGETLYFSFFHAGGMLVAIVVLTIGSALAKRKTTDREKFRTMFTSFLITLLIIAVLIPWPFSPFASRPYFR